MDRTRIIALVNSILPSVSDPEGIEDYDRDSADFQQPRMHRVTVEADALSTLTTELQKSADLARLEGGIYRYSSTNSGSPIKIEDFAHWLLAQSRFRAPEECLTDLLAAARNNSSTLFEIIPIWGISPKHRLEFGDGLRIVPIEDLPPSRLRDLLTGKQRHKFSFDLPNSSPRPGAALILETVHGPMYEASDSETARRNQTLSDLMLSAVMDPSEEVKRNALERLAQMMNPRTVNSETRSVSALAEEMTAVIALHASKPIFQLAHWYQRPPNTPLVGQVGSWSGPTNEHPFYCLVEKQDYPIGQIQDLVQKYQSLERPMRERLRTPLVRLNQSRRNLAHHTVEAAAIDLGIALESLLAQDREQDSPISYVLRTRGALLLGGDAATRKKNYNILRDAYNVRSKVAHNVG